MNEMKDIDFEQELYNHFGQVKDFTLGMRIGKYFYELGKQSSSSETPNDLEEAAQEKYPVYWKDYPKDGIARSESSYDTNKQCRDAFVAGAKWQKVQLMKKAIDAEFCSAGMFMPMIDFKDKRMEGIKYGDTIKVIVIKEK